MELNSLIIGLSICGLGLLLLLVRLVRHRKNRGIATTPADTNDESVNSHTTLAEPSPTTQPTVQTPADISWKDRRLFDGFQGTSQNDSSKLPTVESYEIPTADTKSCTFGRLTPLLASLLPESDERKQEIKKQLQTAGLYDPYAWHNLAALRYVAVMVALIAGGALLVSVPTEMELPTAFLLVTLAVLGWAVPTLFVRSRAKERTGEIELAMPDMLDMLNMCVSQGLTVHESLNRISQELGPVYPALAQELNIICEQAEVGNLNQALKNFSVRIDLPEVHSFARLLIQTEQMGTSISTALTEHSDNMRESLRQQADENANKATFKLLFPTVFCLMPAVYMILLGPAIVELSDFFGEGGGSAIIDSGQQAIEQLN